MRHTVPKHLPPRRNLPRFKCWDSCWTPLWKILTTLKQRILPTILAQKTLSFSEIRLLPFNWVCMEWHFWTSVNASNKYLQLCDECPGTYKNRKITFWPCLYKIQGIPRGTTVVDIGNCKRDCYENDGVGAPLLTQ